MQQIHWFTLVHIISGGYLANQGGKRALPRSVESSLASKKHHVYWAEANSPGGGIFFLFLFGH